METIPYYMLQKYYSTHFRYYENTSDKLLSSYELLIDSYSLHIYLKCSYGQDKSQVHIQELDVKKHELQTF